MPLARATGMGSTLAWADHSNRVCFLVRLTISWPVMAGVAVVVVMGSSLLQNLRIHHRDTESQRNHKDSSDDLPGSRAARPKTVHHRDIGAQRNHKDSSDDPWVRSGGVLHGRATRPKSNSPQRHRVTEESKDSSDDSLGQEWHIEVDEQPHGLARQLHVR